MPTGGEDLSASARGMLKKVKRRYLESRDFNGLHVSTSRNTTEEIDGAVELAEAGMVEVVGPSDYLNIHIRPWPSRRTVAKQIEELRELSEDDYGVCLYPKAKALKKTKLPGKFENAPFSKAMARGRSTLELAFFSADVLEGYRNDARFRFGMGDFGINFGLSDEAFEDRDQPKKDRVGLLHLGFAYDMRQYDPQASDSPIIRRVAAFYGDLDDLTPEHQQRWASFQVAKKGVDPHPVWYASQMGHWPDGMGPFARLAQELKAIGDLFENVWGIRLFRSHELPDDFGWILRADQREWDHFIHSFDKLLSDNIDDGALDKAKVPRTNEKGDPLGTLGRFELFMTMKHVAPESAKWALRPLRQVRAARQKPAHALRTNVTDQTFVRKQKDLLHDVNEVLINIRQWLSSHPQNREWKETWPAAKDYPL
ncbi:ATPase AAA [Paenarthrobacter aurescens]|uniref:ATPase AAA n=2 Tax=Paenarthrobacter aurescens TaxID=43663 RepID=A0A4Y3NG90_PAEAU|nr:ATPase AAA [Paenarthrobacter aurescens]